MFFCMLHSIIDFLARQHAVQKASVVSEHAQEAWYAIWIFNSRVFRCCKEQFFYIFRGKEVSFQRRVIQFPPLSDCEYILKFGVSF